MLKLIPDLSSPFKYGRKVPTDEEVLRVSKGILDDLTIFVGGQDSCHEDEAQKLLSDLVSRVPSELLSDLVFVECTHPEDFVVAEILSNSGICSHQLILTREERHRMSGTGTGLSGRLMPDLLQHSTGLTNTDNITPVFGAGEYLFEDEDEEQFVPAPTKKRRLGDFSLMVEPPEPLLLPQDSLQSTIPLLTTVATSPRQMEPLSHSNLPQLLPAPQNSSAPLLVTSQPRDLVQANLPDTVNQTDHSATGRGIEPGLPPASGRRQNFDEFLTLRGVRLREPPIPVTTETTMENPQAIELPLVPQQIMADVPPGLIDGNTIQLPAADSFPVSRHQYLASLDLLQKNALCRCLSDDPAAVDLIEREFLGGVDLILDQDTAVLFFPLSTLPSECEGLIAGICNISWRYSHILVVFEAFLISQAFDDCEENLLVSFTFTEPMLKSVRKLKRSLMIADGVGTKTEDCNISWAFAKNIEEAARLARVYGDMAESRDTTGGLLWQERWWLGERESEYSPLSEFEVRPVSSPRNSVCLIAYSG